VRKRAILMAAALVVVAVAAGRSEPRAIGGTDQTAGASPEPRIVFENDVIRVRRPAVPPGPRRIGIQAGHWLTHEAPAELSLLHSRTGTSAAGVAEWRLNLEVAERVASALRARGFAADVLPTTVPAGYLADAFVSLHADGSRDPNPRGYKAAHSTRRGPYETTLVKAIVEEYGAVTGLPLDWRVTRGMTGYYAFNWRLFTATVAPHTPAAILEMGFLTSPADRAVLVGRPDVVSEGIVRGIIRFLDEVPAGKAFAEDIVAPAFRSPATPP
jgi:N-acetylmuramoyl-L-alanine amidase